MKQLLFFFSVMALLISCDNTKVAGSNNGSDHASIADRNAEGTKQVFKAIETGDVKGLDTLFTDDVVDHNGGPQNQDIKGKDSVIAALGKMHTYFDGLKLEMLHHATSTDGQYHYATVRMTGTSKQNPWGMPVGLKVDDTIVELLKMKDGKASDHWGFLSWGDINEMMGAMSGGGQNKPQPKADTAKGNR